MQHLSIHKLLFFELFTTQLFLSDTLSHDFETTRDSVLLNGVDIIPLVLSILDHIYGSNLTASRPDCVDMSKAVIIQMNACVLDVTVSTHEKHDLICDDGIHNDKSIFIFVLDLVVNFIIIDN